MDTVLTGKLLRSSTGSNMKMSKSFKPALTKSNYLSVQLAPAIRTLPSTNIHAAEKKS